MSARIINWPVPVFGYGERVAILPMDSIKGRIVDLHFFGMLGTVEYDVVYYADGKQHKIRVFEDDLMTAESKDIR